MLAKKETRNYEKDEKVWVGKYLNSHNILHWHYDCELLYVESGALEVFCENRLYKVNEGTAVFFNSGQMHYQRPIINGSLSLLIMFDYNIVKSIIQNYQLVTPTFSDSYNIVKIFDFLKNELKEKKEFYTHTTALKVAELICEIFRKEKTIRIMDTRNHLNQKDLKALLEERFLFFAMVP